MLTNRFLVTCRTLCSQATDKVFIRTVSITFPRRRTNDGSALTALSLEKFHQSQQQKHTAIPSTEVTLPVDYGRKPLSEEEIAIINLGGAVA